MITLIVRGYVFLQGVCHIRTEKRGGFMLRFVTGAAHSGRDGIFCGMIDKACDNGENVLVIVPDQFSFEYDKKLYGILGAKKFNRIKTAGFNRLAELVSRQYGGGSKENANENAKIITMYKAVRKLKETRDVRFYGKALEKGSFLAQVISLVGELIQSGISPEALRVASEKLDGSVCAKLYDLSRLYRFYLDELSNAGLKDSLTSLGECAKLVKENGFFEDTSIFIDAFSDFSMDEYSIIDSMLGQAKSVTVSLVISNENGADLLRTPFATTVRTRENLKRLAMAHNVPFEEQYSAEFDYGSPALETINRSLYAAAADKTSDCGGVQLVSANDIYEETEYVCSEIMRLVREEGYRFGEIAVAARELSDVSNVIEGTFERYDIPYFIDSRQSAEQSSLVIYLKSIFDCVLTKAYKTENILKYIKSPLCALFDYQVCDLENYCVKWNVQGDMWLSDFTAAEKGAEPPKKINETRRAVIEPLEKFKQACKDASAQDICKALYELLDGIKLSEEIYSVVKRSSGSSNETELELGRASKQLWMTTLGAVQSIYENMGDETISLRRFYELFKLMISQMTVSAPPQKTDSVRCAGAERSRLTGVKALFVMEVNDGVFPADVKPQGLITEREKRLLKDMDISLNSTAMASVEKERLVVYQTVTMPSDKLYIISTETDLQGGVKNPSPLVKMISRMFENPDSLKAGELPVDFFCTSYRTAYYKYLEKSKDMTAVIKNVEDPAKEKSAEDKKLKRKADLIKSVEASLRNSRQYSDRLDFVQSCAASSAHRISEKTAKQLFFGHDLNISATRVSDFYKCPFLYFCKYGLKLFRTYNVSLNQMSKGNLMHRCLEMIMSEETEGRRVYNENFVNFSDEELKERIHREFMLYFDEQMGGDFGKTARFMQELARYEQTAFYIVKLVQTELKDTLFKPAAFEFNLTKENRESILQLTLEKGYTINIRGSVDRADIYEDENGRRFLRIVDYKTGSTKFNIAELYSGLNLQMMIYLLALTKSVNELNPDGKLEPSAIMYAHLKEFPARGLPSDDIDELSVFRSRAKEFQPDGLMISNINTISALNNKYGGDLSLFSFNKDGSISKTVKQPVKEDYFKALEEFALRKVYELADRLANGDIAASPVQTGKGRQAKIPCSYCDYFSVCGNANPKNPRIITDEDKEKLDSELEMIINETKGGEN